jgi:hypothetical protein
VASTHGKRFARKDIHAVHSVLEGCLRLGRPPEAIKPRGYLHFLQANLRQISNQLCLRQSTADSTGPQIDAAAGVLREFYIEGNVSQVQTAAGLQYPDDFGKPPFLLGN